MRSFIIHLTSAADRRANMDHLWQTLPGAEVMPAKRGDTAAAPGDVFTPRYPFPIGAGEVGCFASHRACWQAIVDRGLPGALIAEDDLTLAAPWPDALALLQAEASPDRYIRLPAKAREQGHVLARHGAAQLIRPRVIGLQTVFQWVGRDAAERLLLATTRIDRPVDTFLQMHWMHGQEILTLLPNGVSELPAPSTIQRKSRSGKLRREVNRWLYRRAVGRHPQT